MNSLFVMLLIFSLTNKIFSSLSSKFLEKYKKLMTPLVQIAENMGFEYWSK